jgi:hypothetical protein
MQPRRLSDVISVVVLLVGFVLAVGLMLFAFVLSFCSLGEPCTPAQEQQISLLSLASMGVFLLVPAAVALVRHQARWLLAPLIEAVLIAAFFLALDWF